MGFGQTQSLIKYVGIIKDMYNNVMTSV
jgi:hypothetical protein